MRPTTTRVYRNHHLDSTHWERFEPRDGDIVLSTSIKSGTTWMQYILHHLIFDGVEPMPKTVDVSPWLDEATIDLDAALARLDAQDHPRIVKSHLPLDGLPFDDRVRYVVVARDARDVFMSLWNHYRHLTPHAYAQLNAGRSTRDPDRFPAPPDDIRAFWRRWITSGWFEWETEGYPFWANLGHTRSWWAARHLPNVLLVHYADLLADPGRQIARVAEHVGRPASDERLARIVEATSFAAMKAKANTFLEGDGASFEGGGETFIHKGTNGRWRDVLDEADLALHDEAMARVLDPDCASWLEHGRAALTAAESTEPVSKRASDVNARPRAGVRTPLGSPA